MGISLLDRKLLMLLFIFTVTLVYGQEKAKIKGLSFVASSSPIDKTDVAPIITMNANWVTLMPYGFVGSNGGVMYNSKWQWWGEKEEGIKETIELCKAEGLKIMLKPQIWMRNAYTGDYKLSTEKEWVKFEESYASFILSFLEIAIDLDVEMFCFGTEWREFVKARPEFWNELIKKIKLKYAGELTYAANWDDYAAVPFWKEMDVIGVNGYFPISISQKPDLKELMLGWDVHRKVLSAFSKKFDRKIVFTEIGYRSMEGSTIKPWEHNTRSKYSEEIQHNAYKALFNVLWDETWFGGIFIWKWYHDHKNQGGNGDVDFTPQNKLAEKTIRSFWSK
ncbi:MAG: glycoside hydrolase [Crocinitomix sp.]|nr:glycoside hydrolase [Crocinitomix sp.]